MQQSWFQLVIDFSYMKIWKCLVQTTAISLEYLLQYLFRYHILNDGSYEFSMGMIENFRGRQHQVSHEDN